MSSSKYTSTSQADPGDRRCGRFVVPGATISCEMAGLSQRRKALSSGERSPVVDLSKAGISFLTDSPPKLNRVSVLFSYSEVKEAMRLEGTVIYIVPRGAGLSYRYRVGVEFSPFSGKKGQNSLESLGRLDKLEKTFGHQEIQEPSLESPGQ
jgi:hypothetical protein